MPCSGDGEAWRGVACTELGEGSHLGTLGVACAELGEESHLGTLGVALGGVVSVLTGDGGGHTWD